MHHSDLWHENSKLQFKLEHLYALRTGSKVNWNQEHYLRLLEKLGNPHLKLPPVVHVAGTNGKGSVVAMLRAIYTAQGYKVHAYTSPHLIKVNERICLAGEDISDDMLEHAIDFVLDIIGDEPLSFFEIMTAIAFLKFSQVPADVLLLEVGMGGLMDCTNVIQNPLVSVINRISLDHMMFLGGSLAEIAAQKAGIMKRGVPCVVGYQGEGESASIILDVLQNVAEKTETILHCKGTFWDVESTADGGFSLFCQGKTQIFPRPNLPGHHQIENAGLVLAAIVCSSGTLPVAPENITEGLMHISWRGRLQQIEHGAIEIWLDCGHNDSAGEILARQAEEWAQHDQKPLFLVLGMLDTKDVGRFIHPLSPFLSGVRVVPIRGEPSSLKFSEIQNRLASFIRTNLMGEDRDVFSAIEFLKNSNNNGVRILVAGSVYLAGEVLSGGKK